MNEEAGIEEADSLRCASRRATLRESAKEEREWIQSSSWRHAFRDAL